MHKGTKITIIIAAVLLVLGCVMAGIGYTVSGGNITVDYEQKDKYEKRFSDEVKKIEVELRSEDVELYVISGDEYVVEYYDNARKYFDIELDGDTLRVLRNSVRGLRYSRALDHLVCVEDEVACVAALLVWDFPLVEHGRILFTDLSHV